MSGIQTREIKQPAGAGNIGVVTNVTYAQAVALQTAGTIVPGALYRMTDFQTLHKLQAAADRNDTNVTIPVEVLVLTGLSSTTFEKRVYSESFPDDVIEYTTDNTAWKDLQISGQKGCITLRIDPIRNIDVGNGDWENFIVRRWAVDLTTANPYNAGATRWLLNAASQVCGITTAGAAQTFTALDTNVYDAVTNPDGYKDVRMFSRSSGNGAENIYIKKLTLGGNTSFLMPNFYCEVTTGTNMLRNINIPICNNFSCTNEITNINAAIITNSIFTRKINSNNAFTGHIRNLFLSMDSGFVFDGFSNILNSTIFTLTEDSLHSYGQINGLDVCNIEFLAIGGTTFSFWGELNLCNIHDIRMIIDKRRPMAFVISDLFYNNIIDNATTPIFKDISAQKVNVFFDPLTQSTIETTLAAVAALVLLPTSGTATVLDIFAGVVNLTGSGTVNIDTLTRFLSNNFPVTLKPEAGLIISIAHNNVANGFVNQDIVTANGSNGEVIIITPVGDRWSASGNKIGAIATYVPADPATTNSLVGVMMGLALSFTPTKSGNVMIVLSGDIDNDTPLDGAQIQIRFGTGAAPANGAALTGTQAGSLVKMINPDATITGIVQTVGRFPITINSLMPLTVDVANWVDISLASITGGISQIRDISATLIEQ